MKPELLIRKCYGCSSLDEVGGGVDHGDIRCCNPNSPLYDKRVLEIKAKDECELENLANCRLRMSKSGKVAVVTGASRGIGKAIAEEFGKKGYDLAIISRHFDEIEKVAESLTNFRQLCMPVECDVSNPEQVLSSFEEIFNYFGSIDVLVNNAGVNSRRTLKPENPEKWFEDFWINLEGWNQEIAVNLTGTYMCSYVAAGYMLQRGSGAIINISSIKGKEATSSPGYGASKAGVIKLTIDFAKALAPHNIRVNCVAPGFIDTGMTAELPEEKQVAYRKMIPQGRFGSVDEIAKAVAFLASAEASYITGHTLDVNGGYLMD